MKLDLRREAAALAYEALPSFYGPMPKGAVIDAIAGEFLHSDLEVSAARVAVVAGQVQGLVAGFPAAELARRQAAGLHHLLAELASDELAPFFAHLRSFSAGVPPILPKGHYLARLSVARAQRGSGLADRLLADLLATEDASAGASLHVRADNARAIAFYGRHGFRSLGGNLPYIVMQRP